MPGARGWKRATFRILPRSARGARVLVEGFAVPLDGALEALFQRRLRGPSQDSLRAAHVQRPPGLPVGLRGIPLQSARESAERRDLLRELADRDLTSGAEIDRLAVGQLLR